MRKTDDQISDEAVLARAIAQEIIPMLAGRDAGVCGAVLMELVSIWIAGHNPSLRALIYEQWSKAMHDLVPIQDAIIFSTRPRPPGWE